MPDGVLSCHPERGTNTMLPLKRTVSWWVKGESGVDGRSKYGHRPSDNHVFPKWGLVGANLISILECIGYIVDAESATDLCAAIRSECPMGGEKSINKLARESANVPACVYHTVCV